MNAVDEAVCTRHRHAGPLRRQYGSILISVLIALVIFAFGLLSLGKAYVGMISAATQNEIVTSLAGQSNAFWGIVQANPSLLDSAGTVGTFTSANYSAAPVALQPWLSNLLSPGSSSMLPQGSISIATGPDAVSGAVCSSTSGCTVSLAITWNRNGSAYAAASAPVLRTQNFYFQFVL